jgi:hypothetical protein
VHSNIKKRRRRRRRCRSRCRRQEEKKGMKKIITTMERLIILMPTTMGMEKPARKWTTRLQHLLRPRHGGAKAPRHADTNSSGGHRDIGGKNTAGDHRSERFFAPASLAEMRRKKKTMRGRKEGIAKELSEHIYFLIRIKFLRFRGSIFNTFKKHSLFIKRPLYSSKAYIPYLTTM